MRLNPVFLIGTLLTSLSLNAQNETIRGIVQDTNGNTVPDVVVSMFSTDSTYLGVSLSDVGGIFELQAETMPYVLHFDHISYESLRKEYDTFSPGTVVLEAKSNEIAAASSVAYRPIVKVDGSALSYDLGQLAERTTATNVYEAIGKLPGVDEKDGSFQLAGAGAVTLIINGKPSAMSASQLETVLSAMPIDRIKSADVMYSAPPQYNVRGAVINLVIDRSLENTYSGELRGDFSIRRTPSYGSGGSFAVSNPKWSADAIYRYVDETTTQISDLSTKHTLAGSLHEINQLEDIQGSAKGHIIRAAFDYTPTDKDLLSIVYNGQLVPRSKMISDSNGSFVNSLSTKNEDRYTNSISLRYKSALGLDIGADYTAYTNENINKVQNEYSDGRLNSFNVNSGQDVSRLNFYADMSHPFAGSWTLNYGLRGSWAQDKDYQHYSSIVGELNSFDTNSKVSEWNAELYAGTDINLRQGSLSFSLSGEYNNYDGQQRFTLYPQANFLWIFSQDHIIQANLSSDKSYPSYWQLQNSISYIDGYSEVHGNPLLRPMRDYSSQLVYILRQKFVFALFYTHISDYFIQNAYQTPDRLALIYKYSNFNYLRQYGLNVNLPLSFAAWHDTNLTLTGMRLEEKCDDFFGISFDRGICLGVASLDNTFRLSTKPDISLELSGTYQTPAIQGLFDLSPSWGVDAGMKFSFFDKKLNISAKIKDIFESRIPRTSQNVGGQELQMYTGRYTRSFSLNLTWRFGGYTNKERKSVDTSRFGH